MSKPLLNRLLLAVVEALDDADPVITIGIGSGEMRISWPAPEDDDD